MATLLDLQSQIKRRWNVDLSTENGKNLFKVTSFGLVDGTSRLVKELYLSKLGVDVNSSNLAPYLKQVFTSIILLHHLLGVDTAEIYSKLKTEGTEPSLDLLCAKLLRYSSNTFCVAHAYQDELEADSVLGHDVTYLLSFLKILLTTRNIDPETFLND